MPRWILLSVGVGLLVGCQSKTTPQATAPTGPYVRPGVIDSHTLITPSDESIKVALNILKHAGVTKFCNKNGGSVGSRIFAASLRTKQRLGDRFEFFANVDWQDVNQPNWGRQQADQLEEAVSYGAKGVKFFKQLGLRQKDQSGALLRVDDTRLDPIMRRAAKINAIVAMHTGDPKAFFEPVTPDNERFEELSLKPNWSFSGRQYPTRQQLLQQRDNLIARHPETTFLLMHFANNPEDLDYVASLLDKFPNVYIDTSARIPEVGRQPVEKVRQFFTRYQDRILFGSDLVLSRDYAQLGSISKEPIYGHDAVDFYRTHFRYFETDDKQFDHPTPIQGKWKINGIKLPKQVLQKIYVDNAEKLIFQRQVTVPLRHPKLLAEHGVPTPQSKRQLSPQADSPKKTHQ